MQKNVVSQFYPSRPKLSQKEDSLQFNKDLEENIGVYLSKLNEKSCSLSDPFDEQGNAKECTLRHLFNGTIANKIQRDDLLGFHTNTEKLFEDFCKVFITKEKTFLPGMKKPNKLKKLNNFNSAPIKKNLLQKQTEKRHKDIIAIKNLQIDWANAHNIAPGKIQQFLSYPSAIANSDLAPHKGVKSNSKFFYEKWFEKSFLLGSCGADISCVIIDAMFILYSPPAPGNLTFADHAKRLFKSWVMSWSSKHAHLKEIHLLFDSFDDDITPKSFERDRRDKGHTDIAPEMLTISDCEHVPHGAKWKEFLSNRNNKKKFISYIVQNFQTLSIQLRKYDIKLIIDGDPSFCNTTFEFHEGVKLVCAKYSNNHKEADTKVWLHARVTEFSSIIIYSPDNDIFNIGLGILEKLEGKHILVQTKIHSYPAEYIWINTCNILTEAESNRYLSHLGKYHVGVLLKVLFIISGCDYVSYFKNYSKLTIYKIFLENVDFICGTGNDTLGSLHQVEEHNFEMGFLAFARLMGCVYFKSCANSFIKDVPDRSAQSLFKLVNEQTPAISNKDAVYNWIGKIREATMTVMKSEEFYLPSTDSLMFHWMRGCWVAQVWEQSTLNTIVFPDLNKWGWHMKDNKLCITWDTAENMAKQNTVMKLWAKGCSCKKGCSRRCGCKNREGKSCGPACQCKGKCSNAPPDPNLSNIIEIIMSHEEMDSLINLETPTLDIDLHTDSSSSDSDSEVGDIDSDSDSNDMNFIDYDDTGSLYTHT